MEVYPDQHLPQLATKRLLLRPLQISDANQVFILRSDPIVNQYTGRKLARTVDDSIEFIKKILSGYEARDTFYWAIVPKERQELAGTVCLFNINIVDKKAELGYELLPEWQGRGFMQETLEAIIRFGFRQMQLQAIEAELEERNLPSIRVLERCNFSLLGRSVDETSTLTYRLSAPGKK